MRLNHIESFYAFLLHFHSEGSEEEGRPATTSTHVVSTTHGQGPLQGGSRQQAQVAVARCKAARGNPATRAAACKDGRWGCCLQGRPLAGATASRGSTHARRRRPHARCRPMAAAPTACAVAHADSMQHHRLRRASTVAPWQEIRRMVMRRSDGTDDDKINNHRA
ncbi:hypothetical protein GW17_00042508 [Ensete ventricosum]|nr:hypothetical protein GW17_00042508 [Ensete ventricosum]RZR77402.1 hypothetical protein BHM03_00002456 [Ensete ventricosum]